MVFHRISSDGIKWHWMALDGMVLHRMASGAWDGMEWHGMVWYCIGWHRMALDAMVLHEMARNGVDGIGWRGWHGIASNGISELNGIGWHGMAWVAWDGIGIGCLRLACPLAPQQMFRS